MGSTVAGCVLFMLVTHFCLSTTKGNIVNTTNATSPNATGATVVNSSSELQVSTSVTSPVLTTLPTPTSTPTRRPPTDTISSTKPTQISSTTSTSVVGDTTVNGDDDNEDYKPILIAVAIIAGIAAVVAFVFFVLYLRTSRSCYDHLRGSGSQSPDAFQINHVHNTTSPIRIRLASLSSIRRQAICKSDPLTILEFRDHVKRLHADSDYLFSLEYEVIKTMPYWSSVTTGGNRSTQRKPEVFGRVKMEALFSHVAAESIGGKKYLNDVDKKQDITTHEGKKLNNKAKNRYSDILPYDHSRIVLTEIEGKPDSVYINANYVDSYRKPRAYIAAQGPLSASMADFWRMIWENNARVVVMVTSLFERTKSKCMQYWPDKGSANYGFLTVTMLKEEIFANYVIRTLSVEPSPNQLHYIKIESESESRVIQQFQFTEWPDHDVPVHPVALLRFIRHSKSANPSDAAPLVVHCSAGVGRSGVYMVIDSMMERIEDDKSVDIFNFLNHIRTQRIALVQEESQYIFVHDCILEHINFGDTDIPIREFHKRLQSLRTVNLDTKRSRLREEYEDIDRTKHPEKHKWAGKKNCNVDKNRRKDILPVERTRVKLPLMLGVDGADYINASFIDGFSKKREYIATQAPMVKTAECFYRMLYSTKCSIIVMLLNDEQWEKDDYADLPTEDEAVTCGRFEIQLESQDVTEKVTVRKLRLFSSETSDGHTVTHYHYRDWPSGGFPKDKTSLINFIEQVREHKMAQNSEHPITVHCDYGVGPTGVFCLVSSLYDQIEREKYVNVFHAAKLFRVQRPKLIETEDQYSFCYEVLDQVIARKLISMTTDSDSDEPNSPGIVGNKNSLSDSNPDVMTYHSPGMNGSVVVDTSHAGKESPKAGSPSAGKVNPSAGNTSLSGNKVRSSLDRSPEQIRNNNSTGNESPSVQRDSPSPGKYSPIPGEDNLTAGKDSQIAGKDSQIAGNVITENQITNTDSESAVAVTGNPNADSPEISDVEPPSTSSSRQALLSSSES